jgi:hypothetical protein
MKKPVFTLVILMMLVPALGCDEDRRLVQLAQEANNRQAQQNHAMAQQNQQIAEATKRLVEADAESRQELIGLQRDLEAEKAEVGSRRDELETERRQIAKARSWDSAAAQAVAGGAAVLAALLPLIVCIYVLHHLARGNTDEAIAEVLIGEIVSDKPVLLPPPEANRLAIAARQDNQLDGPDRPQDGTA